MAGKAFSQKEKQDMTAIFKLYDQYRKKIVTEKLVDGYSLFLSDPTLINNQNKVPSGAMDSHTVRDMLIKAFHIGENADTVNQLISTLPVTRFYRNSENFDCIMRSFFQVKIRRSGFPTSANYQHKPIGFFKLPSLETLPQPVVAERLAMTTEALAQVKTAKKKVATTQLQVVQQQVAKESELSKLQKEYEKLKGFYKIMCDTNVTIGGQSTSLLKRAEDSESELAAVKSKLVDTEKERDALKLKYEELVVLDEEHLKELVVLREEAEILRSKLASMENTVASQGQRLTSQGQRLRRVSRENRGLRSVVEQLCAAQGIAMTMPNETDEEEEDV